MSSKEPNVQHLTFDAATRDEESDDDRNLYTHIGRSIAIWCRVETELFYTFANIAHPEGISSGAIAAFANTHSFRQKLANVTATIAATFHASEFADLRAKWKPVRDSLGMANTKRNKLAYGVILKLTDNTTGKTTKGWHPYFDIGAIIARTSVKGNAPGLRNLEILDVDDVVAITSILSEAGRALGQFRANVIPVAMQSVGRVVLDVD
ncbi:MAG: hypothetical protein ACU0C9_09670 [Paracoccaceae bacterium]